MRMNNSYSNMTVTSRRTSFTDFILSCEKVWDVVATNHLIKESIGIKHHWSTCPLIGNDTTFILIYFEAQSSRVTSQRSMKTEFTFKAFSLQHLIFIHLFHSLFDLRNWVKFPISLLIAMPEKRTKVRRKKRKICILFEKKRRSNSLR